MATRHIFATTDEDGQFDQETDRCPECGGRVSTTSIETVCDDCGLILEETIIDRGPEWRYCNREERKRTGAPRTMARHDRGLSTEIGFRTDATGTKLSSKKRRQLNRLRREHRRGKFGSKAERNQMRGLQEVRRISGGFDIPETLRDQACRLFCSAQSADLLCGRSVESIASASVYGACRCADYSITLDEVVSVARVSRSRVVTAYKTLNTELGLPTSIVTARSHVPKITSELAIDDVVRHRAQELASLADEAAIANGRSPAGVAAGCVYKACEEFGDLRTQEAIAGAANVNAITLRARYYELNEIVETA
ncbi:transcription initiation factor IIB family protein [Halopenitus salinus]|uniref:Transcription initiation factor IIB family protein n=1 Tax=Halopenitus salinus TaxID=1198295 RepID=A0ABD5UST3_9EURY